MVGLQIVQSMVQKLHLTADLLYFLWICLYGCLDLVAVLNNREPHLCRRTGWGTNIKTPLLDVDGDWLQPRPIRGVQILGLF